MRKTKGFTLIELLAIIVILAIIAVITVPIILGIIDDAQMNAVKDSAYGYKDSILNYNAYLQTLNPTNPGLNGNYTVAELKAAGLQVIGKEPDSGIVLIDNEGVSGCTQYDEYASYIYNSNVINTVKGNCPTQKLVTTGDGLYKSNTDSGRLIFRGENPNNRILLSEDGTTNTLYRIVSFETDGTIKVVRDDKLSSNMAWDERTGFSSGPRKNSNNSFCWDSIYDMVGFPGCNAWGNGSNTLYNGVPLGDSFHYIYYDSSSATTMTNGSSGTVAIDSSLNTYLNNTWLPTSILDYIDNHSWNVGGIKSTSDKGIIKEKEEERQLKWIGKIGLLSITELVEASTNPNCTSVKANVSSNESLCKNGNWTMYNKLYDQWCLSPSTGMSASVWYANSEGYFAVKNAYDTGLSVRPAFYLKSDVVLSGSGVIGDEYQIN